MSILIVVDNPRDWPLDIPGVAVVSARAYLTDPAYGEGHSVKAFNLCRSYRYQSLGYYVSLLAEARGHKPLPRVSTMEDLQSQNLVRLLTEDLDELAQKSLAPIKSDSFEVSIYFGRNVATRHAALSHQFFSRLQAPLLRAHFERRRDHWHLRSVRAIVASDIPPQHHDFVVEAATAYFMGHRRLAHKRPAPRFDLAILHDPSDPEPPSNARAMQQFEKAAAEVGLAVEF
ncbi:MAG TPA: RimK-like ATPgrasp N-terminal domain-containing protein, partial [Steroidobacteraceae bacterium]|nr:RimK-like ATPgrasp N-terminal domain-containing protein [Steroidobacteraceae bacterium]